MELNNKIINVIEKLDFSLSEIEHQGESYMIELSQFTPLGQDWSFLIWFNGTDASFIDSVYAYWQEFNIDDEAEVFIENRGKYGVPNSIRMLLDDATWKEQALAQLAQQLKEIDFSSEFTFKTIKEVAEELWSLPEGTSIDFTFDQPEDVDETFEPEGWYGAKIVHLFCEPCGTLCIGSWGGGQIMAEEIYERRELEQMIKQFCRDVHAEVDVLCVSSKRNGE